MQEERNRRRTKVAVIVSDRMTGSAVVEIVLSRMHPVYKKVVRKTTRLLIDDPANQAKVGDRVLIMETRPISKRKHWRLVEIVEKSKGLIKMHGEVEDDTKSDQV